MIRCQFGSTYPKGEGGGELAGCNGYGGGGDGDVPISLVVYSETHQFSINAAAPTTKQLTLQDCPSSLAHNHGSSYHSNKIK